MASKPEVTVTVRYKGTTIEMTAHEAKELRDILNSIVGEPQRVVERHDHYHDHYPRFPRVYYDPARWTVSGSSTSTSAKLNFEGIAASGFSWESQGMSVNLSENDSYTISVN